MLLLHPYCSANCLAVYLSLFNNNPKVPIITSTMINNYVKNQADTYFFDDKDRQAQYEAAYRKLIKNRPGDVSISNGGTKDVMDHIKAVEAK